MKTQQVEIDGNALRNAINSARLTQREVAKKVGVTYYAVCRWCRAGKNSIASKNVNILKELLGDEFLTVNQITEASLNDAEAELIKIYRNFSPLNRAKARLAVEDIGKDSPDNKNGP